jgi:protein-S-isoprenylcysteine O-methyltransferase Ste14
MLINIGLPLITQHWLVVLLGCLSLVIYYQNTIVEEAENLTKFGDDYRAYQQRVPRLNFLLGLFRVVSKAIRRLIQ